MATYALFPWLNSTHACVVIVKYIRLISDLHMQLLVSYLSLSTDFHRAGPLKVKKLLSKGRLCSIFYIGRSVAVKQIFHFLSRNEGAPLKLDS